jgi:hypothetical protein
MILGGNNIRSWDQMKKTFIDNYRDYCKARDTRDNIFKMIQGVNEYLEDYEERFQLGYKRDHSFTLDENSLKLAFLRGVREELMDILKLLENEDIFQLYFECTKKVFKNYSISTWKMGRNEKSMVT